MVGLLMTWLIFDPCEWSHYTAVTRTHNILLFERVCILEVLSQEDSV